MAKDELDRASRAAVEEVAVGSKQHDAAELLKKLKVVADTDAPASADTAAAADAPVAQAEPQTVASADSIFASDAAPTMVAQAGAVATDASASTGMSTGTLLAIGGVALVGGGIAIAANNDGGGHKNNDTPPPPPPTITAVTASATAIDEGGVVTYTVTGTPGESFAYAVAGDSSATPPAGTVVIGSDGTGTFSVSVPEDQVLDGTKTLTVTFPGQTVTVPAVTVNDTSTIDPALVTFTTNQNEHLTGTAADDTFYSPLIGTSIGSQVMSFQNGDTADGGAGNDTLNLSVLQGITFGSTVLNVNTTSVETINVDLIHNGAVGGTDFLYLANDVTTLNIAAAQPVTIQNDLDILSAQGLTNISLRNINESTISDLRAATISVSVANVREGSLAPANNTALTLVADPFDLLPGAAQTLNLTVDCGNVPGLLPLGFVDVKSNWTQNLNLTVAGAGLSAIGTEDWVKFDTGAFNSLKNVVIGGVGDLLLDVHTEQLVSFDASALAAIPVVGGGGVTSDLYSAVSATGDYLLATVKGGQGNDVLTVDHLATAGASVDLGTGNDSLTVGTTHGVTTILAGGGNDTVEVGSALKNLSIDLGAGDDAVTMHYLKAGAALSITGGLGNDFVDLSGLNNGGGHLVGTGLLVAVNAGDGNDTVDFELTGPDSVLDVLKDANYAGGTFATHVLLDGGAGTADRLIITAYDGDEISTSDIDGFLPDGVFNASVTGFEQIAVGDIGEGDGVYTYYHFDMDALDGQGGVNWIAVSDSDYAFGGSDFTRIDHLDSGDTIEFYDLDNQFNGYLQAFVRNSAAVNTPNDVLNIAVNAVADQQAMTAVALSGLGGNGFATDLGYLYVYQGVETLNFDLHTPAADPGEFTLVLNSVGTHTINVTGDAGLDLISFLYLGKTDTSDVTLFDASTSTGNVGFDADNTASVTIKGGSGNDILFGGDGTNADTISGGAGNDIIGGSTGLDKLSGGAGKDTFVVVANTSSGVHSTVSDFNTSEHDSIDFTAVGAVTTFHASAITLAPGSTLDQYLDAAGTAGSDSVSWFNYGGNTYVVLDHGPGADPTTFSNGVDQVIELTGTIDLSHYDHSGSVITG